MKRSALRLIGFMSMALVLLSGLAANGGSDAAAPSGDTDEPVVLTLLVDNQSDLTGLMAVAEAAEEQIGIRVEIELRPGGAEGDNLLRTRLVAQEMTDLNFYNSGSLFTALNPQNHFVDLSDEPFMDRILESFQSTVSAEGGVYAIPTGAAMAGGWFYNKTVYADLGLEVPTTWNQLMENNEIIKAAGIQPVIAPYKDSWTAQLLVLADYYNVASEYPGFADDYTANVAGFADTPIALRGFEKLAEVNERGFIGTEAVSTGYEDALAMLLSGEGAHWPMLAFILPALRSMDPEAVENIGFFPQPGDSSDNNGVTLWMPAGISIYRGSENVEAARRWLEFYVSDEGARILMEAQPPEGPYVIQGVELPADVYTAVRDIVPFIESGESAAALEFLSPIKGPNLPQICVEVGIGISTPDEAAAAYDRDVEKQAKQLGLSGW